MGESQLRGYVYVPVQVTAFGRGRVKLEARACSPDGVSLYAAVILAEPDPLHRIHARATVDVDGTTELVVYVDYKPVGVSKHELTGGVT